MRVMMVMAVMDLKLHLQKITIRTDVGSIGFSPCIRTDFSIGSIGISNTKTSPPRTRKEITVKVTLQEKARATEENLHGVSDVVA